MLVTADQIYTTVLSGWLAVSGFLILNLRILSPVSLAAAPTRQSKLSLPVVGIVIVAFFLAQVAVLVGAIAFGFVSTREAGLTTTSSQAATTTAAPLTTTTTTTASQPATSTASFPQPDTEIDAARGSVLITLIYLLAAIPVLLWVPRQFPGGIAGWGLHVRQIPRGILYGLLGFAIIFPLVQFFGLDLNYIYSFFHYQMSEHPTFQALDEPNRTLVQKLILYGSAVVVAPLAEELFFRGILQTTLIQFRWGLLVPQLMPPSSVPVDHRPSTFQRWAAIVIASLAFAAVHQGDQAPIIFVLALGLGYVYERTGILWASMALHAAFNGTEMLLYNFGGS